MTQQLVLGQTIDGGTKPFTVDADRILYHTAVIGQSGTGKSFFLARLLEETLLKTHARVVVLDPNGDFGKFYAAQPGDFWTVGDFSERLSTLYESSSVVAESFDRESDFRKGWSSIKFQFVDSSKKDSVKYGENALATKLRIHWKRMPWELQDFLLDIDPVKFPKIFQGIASCYHFVDQNPTDFPQRVSLSDLEYIAKDFELKKIHVTYGKHDEAISLTSDDWLSIRMQFRKIRKRFNRLFYTPALKFEKGTIPIDLGRYIELGFQEDARWQICTVSMASQTRDEMLLSSYVTLSSIWRQSVKAWRVAQAKYLADVLAQTDPVEELDPDESAPEDAPEESDRILEDETEVVLPTDLRLPTIIVIDEAQNFAPDIPLSPLQEMVSDLVATIAAEGRKYGICIVFATQRPQKLRSGLLAECENGALLKIQSKVEQAAINEAMTAPNNLVYERVGNLDMGESLLFGQWATAPTFLKFGPARTVLGGANIDPDVWIRPVGSIK